MPPQLKDHQGEIHASEHLNLIMHGGKTSHCPIKVIWQQKALCVKRDSEITGEGPGFPTAEFPNTLRGEIHSKLLFMLF